MIVTMSNDYRSEARIINLVEVQFLAGERD